MSQLTQCQSWKALQTHQETLANTHLRQLFKDDPERFHRFSFTLGDLFVDFSKNLITPETLQLLCKLAKECELSQHIEELFTGKIVNFTENRAALHTALRASPDESIIVNDKDVINDVAGELKHIKTFVDQVRSEKWQGFDGKTITDVVNIGVGGSDLGPVMAIQALQAYTTDKFNVHFVSSMDGQQSAVLLEKLDPSTTLFIIASKTFSTSDTLSNAKTCRDWFLEKTHQTTLDKHFIGVSTKPDRMTEFGISTENQFLFWDWVGGRYSMWSSIGLSIALAIGFENFTELLKGAHETDEHFRTTPFEKNIPVLMGLLNIWYTNFFNAKSHAILPYDSFLSKLPSYFQQLEMESCGKHVTKDGETVDYDTGGVIWGDIGMNGQHAFFQLLHQGTQFIPIDFIAPIQQAYDLPHHHHLALANALAQSEALMMGQTEEETRQQLKSQNENQGETMTPWIAHRVYPGNCPSTTILFPRVTPSVLGSLIALYEHKVYTQSVIWNIDAFDQWGVELGKRLASKMLTVLSEDAAMKEMTLDGSTRGLIEKIKGQLIKKS